MFSVIYNSLFALRFFMTSLGFCDPEIGRGVPNRARLSKNNNNKKQTNMVLIFYISLFSVQNKLTEQREMQYCE